MRPPVVLCSALRKCCPVLTFLPGAYRIDDDHGASEVLTPEEAAELARQPGEEVRFRSLRIPAHSVAALREYLTADRRML